MNDDRTDRYRAACESEVISSTTASGARFGGTLAAVAAPLSDERIRVA